jgi:hypothetical protein
VATLTVTTNPCACLCRAQNLLLVGIGAILVTGWRWHRRAGHAPTPAALPGATAAVGACPHARVSGARGPPPGPSPARAVGRPASLAWLRGPAAPLGPGPGAAGPPSGRRSWRRPQRACCVGCGATHVLVAAVVLPRRADRVESSGRRGGPPPTAAGTGRSRPPWAAARHGAGLLHHARQRAGWLRALAMRQVFEFDPCSGRS